MKIDYTTLDPNIFLNIMMYFIFMMIIFLYAKHIKLNLLKMNKNNYYIIHPGEISKNLKLLKIFVIIFQK